MNNNLPEKNEHKFSALKSEQSKVNDKTTNHNNSSHTENEPKVHIDNKQSITKDLNSLAKAHLETNPVKDIISQSNAVPKIGSDLFQTMVTDYTKYFQAITDNSLRFMQLIIDNQKRQQELSNTLKDVFINTIQINSKLFSVNKNHITESKII